MAWKTGTTTELYFKTEIKALCPKIIYLAQKFALLQKFHPRNLCEESRPEIHGNCTEKILGFPFCYNFTSADIVTFCLS